MKVERELRQEGSSWRAVHQGGTGGAGWAGVLCLQRQHRKWHGWLCVNRVFQTAVVPPQLFCHIIKRNAHNSSPHASSHSLMCYYGCQVAPVTLSHS